MHAFFLAEVRMKVCSFAWVCLAWAHLFCSCMGSLSFIYSWCIVSKHESPLHENLAWHDFKWRGCRELWLFTYLVCLNLLCMAIFAWVGIEFVWVFGPYMMGTVCICFCFTIELESVWLVIFKFAWRGGRLNVSYGCLGPNSGIPLHGCFLWCLHSPFMPSYRYVSMKVLFVSHEIA